MRAMAPSTPLLSFLGALALAGGASAASTCNKCVLNSCARAVRYATTGPDNASRLADCSDFLAVTVTPAPSTTWATAYSSPVTVTVTTTPPQEAAAQPTTPVGQTVKKKRGTITSIATAPTVPAYVSPRCSDGAQYGSACSCWFRATASTVTAFVADITSTTTLASTVTRYEFESPPLATSAVSFPADAGWTKTYTYSEYTLPVFTSAPDPSVVVDFPTPVETCLMEAVPTGDAFYLLAPGAGYVVKRGGALGPVEPPADEAAAAALLANWNPPTFEFQAAEGARDGLFDLVVRDGVNPDLYVALDVETGEISLFSASTSGVAQNGKSTTVFGVSCHGSLLLEYNSVTYVWTTTDSGTIATPGKPATDNTADALNTMLLLPVRVRTPLAQAAASTTPVSKKQRRSPPGTTPWKRDMSQYGVAQRCPNFNSQMVAVSNGRRGSDPNGCGPDGAWYSVLVPNLNFGGCCNTHDVCYDSCPQYFEKCNGDFLTCMLNSCNKDYDHWYSSWLLPGCYAAADLYYIAVSGETAQKHFQEGSQTLCDCQCADSNFAICTQGQKTCQRVRGAGNNDSKNCGGCGFDCGSKAHCADSQCICNPAPPTPNQCGNMCMDFLTHPRHCGRCNNVCESGYCYQGACFTPPDDSTQCFPVNAITNGDFSAGLSGWSVYTSNGYPFTLDVRAGQTAQKRALYLVPDQNGDVTGGFMETPWYTITASTTLRLCAGVQYKLDFQVNTNNNNDASLWAQAATTWIAPPGQMTIPINGYNVWSAQGPYDLPIFHEGDQGVTVAEDGSLRVQLSISFYTGRDTRWHYQLTDVDVYSTG